MSRSDYNKSGYKPSISDNEELHSDLDINLQGVGVSGFKKLFPLTDVDAIKSSVKNLVLTNVYDRPFQPELSSNLTALLFENAGPVTQMRIKYEIERVIKQHEPRVKDVAVSVNDDHERNAYSVTIQFSFADGTSGEGTFVLKRLR